MFLFCNSCPNFGTYKKPIFDIYLLLLQSRSFIKQSLTMQTAKLSRTIKRIIGFVNVDHLCVTLIVLFLGWFLAFASINLSVIDPVKKAFADFSMTDIYYEIQNSSGVKEINNDIVLVDMTELYDRRKIASCIEDIEKCQPKVFVVDLIFERPSYDEEENEMLINAIANIKNGVISCKLINYDSEKDVFKNVRTSFFDGIEGDYSWAFSNVISGEGYGCIRKYSQNEKLGNKNIYSLPYMAVCKYTDTKPYPQSPKQRNIEYSHTDFLVIKHNEVLKNRELLKNKIVILGTINEEADTHITPLGKMAGMKIQAYAMLSSMAHHRVYTASNIVSLIIAILVCYLSAWVGAILPKKRPYSSIYWMKFYYFGVTTALVGVNFILFARFNYYVSLLLPLVGLALIETARLQYKWIIMMLSKHTKLNFIKKSIYYVKP